MEKVKVSKVCEISNGYAFKSSKYVDEGARVIRITNVQKGRIVDNDPKFYSLKDVEDLERYEIYENDILMSLTGNVGRVGKFPVNMLPAYINQRVCRVMPKVEYLDENYLYHYFNSLYFERKAIESSTGVAQLNLSTTWLNEHEIPLPSLARQKEIAAQLDKAQELINYNQELLEKYDELQQSIFLDMFGDPVLNEKAWELVNFEKILSLKRGYDLPVSKRNLEGEINVFGSNGILSKHDEYKVDFPIIITGRSGTIGRVFLTNEKSWPLNTALYSYKTNGNNIVYLMFLINYFRLERFSHGAGVPTLDRRIVHREKLPNIPLKLQNEFASQIASIEHQKTLVEQALQHSEDIFNGLLQEFFG